MFLSSLSRKQSNHLTQPPKLGNDASRRLQKAVVLTAHAALNLLLSSTYIQQEMLQAGYTYFRKYAGKLKNKNIRV